MHPYTFAQRGATLGAEAIPTGWTRNLGTNATSTSDGTTYTVDTSANVALQDRIGITTPPLATSIVYAVGYFHVTGITSAGAGVGACASIFHDDGTKRRLVGPATTGAALRFSNSDGRSKLGAADGTTVATRSWLEYVGVPGDNAQVSIAHAARPNLVVDFATNTNIGVVTFQIGDSSTSVSAASHFEDFRVYELTI